MHCLFSQSVLKEQGINVPVYDNGTIFLISGLAMVICLGCMASFPDPVLRLFLIAILVGLGVLKREMIMGIIKSIRK